LVNPQSNQNVGPSPKQRQRWLVKRWSILNGTTLGQQELAPWGVWGLGLPT
jgi:hypothetical protein